MNYKIGDIVICIKEKDIPEYVGTIWTITRISNRLIHAENCQLSRDSDFCFFIDEVAPVSSLHKALL